MSGAVQTSQDWCEEQIRSAMCRADGFAVKGQMDGAIYWMGFAGGVRRMSYPFAMLEGQVKGLEATRDDLMDKVRELGAYKADMEKFADNPYDMSASYSLSTLFKAVETVRELIPEISSDDSGDAAMKADDLLDTIGHALYGAVSCAELEVQTAVAKSKEEGE